MPRPDENPLARVVEKLDQQAGIPDKAIAAILQVPYVARHLSPGSFFLREGATADNDGAPRHHGNRDGEDDIRHSRAQQGNHHQRQNDQWKRQKQIHETLEHEIDLAAEIGAGHAEERAEGRAKERRREADP